MLRNKVHYTDQMKQGTHLKGSGFGSECSPSLEKFSCSSSSHRKKNIWGEKKSSTALH